MKNIAVHKAFLAAITGCIGLACPAAPAGALSATRPVIAILDDELFVGNAEGHLDGAGTLAIRSQQKPALTCLGEFTSSPELGGSGTLQCNDGTRAIFRFQRLSVFHGHGAGSYTRGTMTFTYGISAAGAAPYLKLPSGKKLSAAGTELALVDQ